jgi:hypothetical protein
VPRLTATHDRPRRPAHAANAPAPGPGSDDCPPEDDDDPPAQAVVDNHPQCSRWAKANFRRTSTTSACTTPPWTC